MGDAHPSLGILATARYGLQWDAPGEDTGLETRAREGREALGAWHAAAPKRIGLRSRGCLLPGQSYSPSSMTVLFPVTFSFSKKRAAVRSPGGRRQDTGHSKWTGNQLT